MQASRSLFTLVVLTIPVVACVDDGTADETAGPTGDEPTSVISQKLSFGTGWQVGGPGNVSFTIPGATGSNQTCFLTGIRGSLVANKTGFSNTTAWAGVFLASNNTWVIDTSAGYGTGVAAEVACVAFTSRTPISTSGATAAIVPGRTCFLTAIEAIGGGWSNLTNLGQVPFAQVIETGNVFTIQQGLVGNSDGSQGGTAQGLCLDMPNTRIDDWEADGGTGPNGRVQGQVEDNSQGGWMCGASMIAGAFAGGFNDPNFAAKFFGTGNAWNITAGPRMRVGGHCMF